MEETFLDRRKIRTMEKDLREVNGETIYPKEDESVDLSSFSFNGPKTNYEPAIIQNEEAEQIPVPEIPVPEVEETTTFENIELPIDEEEPTVEEVNEEEEEEEEEELEEYSDTLPSAIDLGLEDKEEEVEEEENILEKELPI
ncbi:MAG: hypothetical protein PHU17_01820, partial [Candidatus Pacebacteria bacterium]|nr:hypothetical protein [Candidatus Paceibacterota bacterium]